MQFLGHGNPDNKIWFIGIEEGGDIGDKETFEDVLKKRQNNKYLFMENSNQKTQVWDIISNLMNEVTQKFDRGNMFDEHTSSFFLSNLFPLPKPNISNEKLSEYSQYFGDDILDYYKYLSLVRSERYPIIYDVWKEKNPLLTICFGSNYHTEFINLLDLGHSKFTSILNGKLFYYKTEKVLLCPFFNYRFVNKDILEEIKMYIENMYNESAMHLIA